MTCRGDWYAWLKATDMLAVGRPGPRGSVHSPVPSPQLCGAGDPLAQGHQPTPSSSVSLTGEMAELDRQLGPLLESYCVPGTTNQPAPALGAPPA